MEAKTIIILLTSFMISGPGYSSDRCETIFATEETSQYKTKEVMDISRTEKTLSYIATPIQKTDIIDAISYAKAQGLKVTIKGTNHSHGGHNRREADANDQPRAIQLDMLSYNKILKLDRKNMEDERHNEIRPQNYKEE